MSIIDSKYNKTSGNPVPTIIIMGHKPYNVKYSLACRNFK